jgi:hypothetical protein
MILLLILAISSRESEEKNQLQKCRNDIKNVSSIVQHLEDMLDKDEKSESIEMFLFLGYFSPPLKQI